MKFGTKAENLINLKIKSATIPKSIYFTTNYINSNFEKCFGLIKSKFKNKLIIRSSSYFEDSYKSSKAGAYKSVGNVNVKKKNQIKNTIKEVINSYDKPNKKNQILFQEYLDKAKMSGVITTCNLEDYGPYYNINYSFGKNTALVTSGKDRTYNAVIFRGTKTSKLNILNKKLIKLCKELETIYKNKYLDIEFLFQNKKLYLLQVRPIILNKKKVNKINIEKKINKGLLKLERKIKKLQSGHHNLFGNTTYFGVMPDWNPAEIIGIKPKELSNSLYRELITNKVWAENRDDYGFKNVKSNQLMTNFLGTPYVDIRVDFNSWIPKILNENLTEKLVKFYLSSFKKNKSFHDKIEFEVLYTCFTPSSVKKITKLKKFNFSNNEIKFILNSLKHINQIAINKLDNEIDKIEILVKKQKEIADKKMYPIEKIYWLIEDCKNYGTSCFAGIARCGFIGVELLNSFVKENYISENERKKFFSSINSITTEMINDLSKGKEKFIKKYGHLRPNTYDICSKNYKDGFEDYFGKNLKTNNKKKINKYTLKKISKLKIKNFVKSFSGNKISFEKLILFIKKSIYYREYSKFIFSKSIDMIFDNLKLISKRNNISINEIQHLDIQVIKEMYYSINTRDVSNILKKNIENNIENYEINKFIKLPEVITKSDDIYTHIENKSKINFIGDKTTNSEIIFIKKIENPKNYNNKIVCIENADPGYDFLFNHKIKGLITKYGGANSHMTIRCAELNIPAAIGVGNYQFEKIKKEKKIFLDPINKKITLF